MPSWFDRARLPFRGSPQKASLPIRVLRDAIRAVDEDNCLGLAAQLAFDFLQSLFPALLFLVAPVSYLPVENAMAELLSALSAVAPRIRGARA